MSDRIETFAVGERLRIEASTTVGRVTVAAGDPSQVVVRLSGSRAAEMLVEHHGEVISVGLQRGVRRWSGRVDIDLAVPEQASLVLAATSGDIVVDAPVANLSVSVASGDVRVGAVAGDARIRTASGDVDIADVGRGLEVTAGSGTVRIGTVGGDLTVTTGSGDIATRRVGGVATLRSASADITLGRFDGDDLGVTTLAGDIRVGIPPRRLLEVDVQTLSGDLRNRLPQGDASTPERTVTLRLKTVSGDVTLEGA